MILLQQYTVGITWKLVEPNYAHLGKAREKESLKNIPTLKIGTLPQTSPILLEFARWT